MGFMEYKNLASTDVCIRPMKLWADLTRLHSPFIGPWIFVGDFNAVLGDHEKRGKRLPPKLSCEDFLLWTNANQLTHLTTIGVHFTWANGRAGNEFVVLRLDLAIWIVLLSLGTYVTDGITA
ncbi:endonuclease/exonuclease/phosphatase family protein [Trifolium medium]|uniref:Endonuclease/exonuclease/phosphatase family protein n=1 Tax=Trifolium medium TaxID=97028 RepID=A0A392MLZ1_9FABA|nr:endonuclease/exonuclease/phosphatase family protein [Trifolium medium]